MKETKPFTNFQFNRRQEMNSYNPIRNPENFARVFSQYVRALVQLLIWATIGFVSIAGAYVAARTAWVAVKVVLRALGI
jgi:hypothetical protein